VPKYLMEAKFTAQGLEGLRRDGGTARRAAVERAVESLGGTLESFHFAFGDCDTYTIMTLPDDESAAALSLAVGASGALTSKIVVLLTPGAVDTAMQRAVDYRRPGS
jgi:uncharacterized protein with GYD domain